MLLLTGVLKGMESYYFTLEEAEELLPEVEEIVEEAVAIKRELRRACSQLLSNTEEGLEGVVVSNPDRKEVKRVKFLNQELRDVVEELEDLGVVVRDLEKGVVDFPTVFQRRKAFFCWRLGEEGITRWHFEECSEKERRRILRLGK